MQTKFTLFLAAMLCAAVSTKAQVAKGDLALGGNLSLGINKQKNENNNKSSTTIFSIAPSIGTVYKDNRMIGFVLRYKFLGDGENKDLNTNSFGAGVYLRQYKPLGKGFYVFAQESLNVDLNHYRGVYTYPAVVSDRKETNIFLVVNPGLAYDISKKIQLELLFFNNLISAGYMHANIKYEPDNSSSNYKQDNFYINSNLDFAQVGALNVGMKIFLGR